MPISPLLVKVLDGLLMDVKVAVTEVAAFSVTTQVPVPLQPPPLHPVKDEPVPAAAVSVTGVPEAKAKRQLDPQLIPLGLLVTVPLPLPVLATESAKPAVSTKVADV